MAVLRAAVKMTVELPQTESASEVELYAAYPASHLATLAARAGASDFELKDSMGRQTLETAQFDVQRRPA